MGPVEIRLTEAIEAHGELIDTITLMPVRAAHLRELPVSGEMTFGALLDIGASCAGLPKKSVNDLAAADALQLVEAVGGFLGKGRGETPLS